MTKFEDSIAWQKARDLSRDVYREFSKSRDFGFRDQICRAGVSVMNNIAEGFERNSDRELKQFLFIAKGSCGEVRSMLILALDLDYVSIEKQQHLLVLTEEVASLIGGFIKSLDVRRGTFDAGRT